MPEKIDGDNMAVGEATIINMTLTNIGLIAADNVRLIMPGNATEWKFEPLAYQEPFRLDAHKSVTVPVRITRLPDPTEMVPSAGKRTFATDTYETYANCMNYLGAYYDVMCGESLRTTQTVRAMAMKFCAFMAPLGAIANLSPGGTPAGEPWGYDGGSPQGSEYNGTPEASFDLCNECDMQRVNNALKTLVGKTYLGYIDTVLDTTVNTYIADGLDGDYIGNFLNKYLGGKVKAWDRERIYGDFKDFVNLADNINTVTAPCDLNNDDDFGTHLHPYDPSNGFDPDNPRLDSIRANRPKYLRMVSSDRSWMDEFDKVAYDYTNQLLRMDAIFRYLYGDRVWYTYMDSEKADFLS